MILSQTTRERRPKFMRAQADVPTSTYLACEWIPKVRSDSLNHKH